MRDEGGRWYQGEDYKVGKEGGWVEGERTRRRRSRSRSERKVEGGKERKCVRVPEYATAQTKTATGTETETER